MGGDPPCVVITGASTGIGHAAARLLAEQGFHVFAGIRRPEDASRFPPEDRRIAPIRLDVADPETIRPAVVEVSAQLGGKTLGGLVNNAGIAIGGPLLHQPIEAFRRQLEVNLIGAVQVTQAFLPLLGADRTRRGSPGRIVNISSLAGRIGFPFMGGYVASKHGLEGLSDSLRRELLVYGIKVIVVEPGSTATPIWDKAEQEDYSAYAGTDYEPSLDRLRAYMLGEGRRGFPPEKVAAVIARALSDARPPHRLAILPGKFVNWTVPRLLPSCILDWLVARQIGLRPLARDGAGTAVPSPTGEPETAPEISDR